MQCDAYAPQIRRSSHAEELDSAAQGAQSRHGSELAGSLPEYLLGITNDILDLSKMEAGKMSVGRTTCLPFKILAQVASLVRVKADGKGLAFDIE